MKKIKEPTDSLKENYANLFKRNQNKWIRRSKLEEKHLGTIFDIKGEKYELVGAIDTLNVLVKSFLEGNYYMTHIDEVTKLIFEIENKG